MRGFTLERNRITALHVGSVSIVHLIYIVIQKTITARPHTHRDAFSCICKYFVMYLRFVQTDPAFWEPHNAIF